MIAPQSRVKGDCVISIFIDPGKLKTDLQRHTGNILMRMSEHMLCPAIFRAYTELWAATSTDVILDN